MPHRICRRGHPPRDPHQTALRGEVIELLGTRNLREMCLPDSRFAYEKFAYVSKEILIRAN